MIIIAESQCADQTALDGCH